MKIAIAQLNPTLGDIQANSHQVREARRKVAKEQADLVVFPELFITGYPPEDLVLKPAFIETARRAVEELAAETAEGGPAILIGTPWKEGEALYNAVALLDSGKVENVRFKVELPNYSVFDEKRIFTPGPLPGPILFRGIRIGTPICEDIWQDQVSECLMETGCELLIVPNGSPYSQKKYDRRMALALERIQETGLPMIYVNQVGGQDELVFDGASFVLNHDYTLSAQLPAWQEALEITEWERKEHRLVCKKASALSLIEEGPEADYLATVLGLRDYVEKNGFPGVVLGLSGGIDSALSAAISVDALGADKVHSVMLPYRYTSGESLDDAARCAKALSISYDIIDIHQTVDSLTESLSPLFKGLEVDVTEENIQSRVRGTLLMALSNKFNRMVVTTGNKSEMSVGYATLYGDMNGGFNPIKDLYKTEVYDLARFRNSNRPKSCLGPEGAVIPENILTKAPTAELRDNQKDQDSLPDYEQLDDILKCLVEDEMPLAEILLRGHEKETIRKIEHLLYVAEYKRRQAAPGVKISARNFGRDRRYPMTNKFREEI